MNSCPHWKDSSNDEVRNEDLSVALEEHADRPAPPIVVECLCRILRGTNARAIDLDDDVPTLDAEIVRDSIAHVEYQCALRRPHVALGANGWRDGHQLQLFQHLDFRRCDFRLIGNRHLDAELTRAAPNAQVRGLTDAQVEQRRFPVELIANGTCSLLQDHVSRLETSFLRR